MMTKTSEETVQAAVRLPKSDLDQFDEVAAARRTSRAALLRECILDKIKEEGTA